MLDQEPQTIFAGAPQPLSVRWHNSGGEAATVELRLRLLQASSATVAPLGDAPRKKLELLPGQTVLESVTLAFPPVRAETRFLVQWLADTNRVLGVSEILAYPPDLLKELKTLANGDQLGVFDPLTRLKPLLQAVKIKFQDLEDTGVAGFRGRLAVIGPFSSAVDMRDGLAGQIKSAAANGAGIVWLQPPPSKREGLKPSFYTVTEGKGRVVVAQAELVADLARDPQAQLNLLSLARLALNPELPRLPES